MTITNEQVQQVFAPIFDSALKYAGIQADGYIQQAKKILAENLGTIEEKEEVKEDGGE